MSGWLDPADSGLHSRLALGHTFRYRLAAGFIRPGEDVLDAACGCGYGTRILAERAHWVQALDNDPGALARAKLSYGALNVSWMLADLDQLDALPEADVAVSFETMEHLDRPEHFAQCLRAAARRLMIVSTPVIPTVGVNPHHKHDFTEESFREMLLVPPWTLWEQVRQGPYLVLVAYRHEREHSGLLERAGKQGPIHP